MARRRRRPQQLAQEAADHAGCRVLFHNCWDAPLTGEGAGHRSGGVARVVDGELPGHGCRGRSTRQAAADGRSRAGAAPDPVALRAYLAMALRLAGGPTTRCSRSGGRGGRRNRACSRARGATRPTTTGGFSSGARARSAAPWARTARAGRSFGRQRANSCRDQSRGPSHHRTHRGHRARRRLHARHGGRQWDTIILATKAHHTEAAARALLPHWAPECVISAQNGLNELSIASIVGAGRTDPGRSLTSGDY